MTERFPFDLVRKRPNIFGFSGLDRRAHLRHEPDHIDENLAHDDARLVVVWRSKNLVVQTAEGDGMDAVWLGVEENRHLLEMAGNVASLGHSGDTSHVAIDLSHLDETEIGRHVPTGAMFGDLREIGSLLGRFDGSILAYARGLMFWHKRHGFCGVCGSPTIAVKGGHERDCTNENCRTPHFPRTDPAVIMLVHDGDRVLLGTQAIWTNGMYSTLAGFVEPGETLEEAVAREVWEESGIEVRDVRYHSSQPWPFPASIMLGFHAEAKTTEIKMNDKELADCQWFSRNELLNFESLGKKLPREISIARRLIEDWLAEQG